MNEHVTLALVKLCSFVWRAKYKSSPIGDQLPPASLDNVQDLQVGGHPR